TINAPVGGTNGLLKFGTGTLVLTNTANSYDGGTVLRFGRISFAGDVPASGASPLGTGTVQLGDSATGTSDAMALYLTGSLTFSRNLTTSAPRGTGLYVVGVDAAGAGATHDGDFTWSGTGATGTLRRASLTAVQADATLTVNGRLATATGGG